MYLGLARTPMCTSFFSAQTVTLENSIWRNRRPTRVRLKMISWMCLRTMTCWVLGRCQSAGCGMTIKVCGISCTLFPRNNDILYINFNLFISLWSEFFPFACISLKNSELFSHFVQYHIYNTCTYCPWFSLIPYFGKLHVILCTVNLHVLTDSLMY